MYGEGVHQIPTLNITTQKPQIHQTHLYLSQEECNAVENATRTQSLNPVWYEQGKVDWQLQSFTVFAQEQTQHLITLWCV